MSTVTLDSLLKADLKALADDAGVEVIINGVSMSGIKHVRGLDALQNMGIGGISGNEIFVAVPTDSLPPGPLPNSTTMLTVDGVEYRLRDARAEADSDGAVTYLFCEAV